MQSIFSISAVSAAVLTLCAIHAPWAAAQTPQLKEITVTGNPLGASDLIAPGAQYSGDGLLLRSKTRWARRWMVPLASAAPTLAPTPAAQSFVGRMATVSVF